MRPPETRSTSEFPAALNATRLFDRTANERLILSIIQKAGPLPSAAIARLSGLSAQSASVITRSLEADGLLVKGDRVRGKVGKPLTPFMLNENGVFSVGLRIGRRSSDMVLLDFSGAVRKHLRATYPFPTPDGIVRIARTSTDELLSQLDGDSRRRVAGIGVGAPYAMWQWLDSTSTPRDRMSAWKGFSYRDTFGEFTDLPVFVGNDASLACSGEHVFGGATKQTDFLYFYIGSFIGGGIVLNGRLYSGKTDNAGALASLPFRSSDGTWDQLISHASIVQLEDALEARWPGQAHAMLLRPEWTGFEDLLEAWLDHTAESVAYAALSGVAVLGVPHVVVDCGAPDAVRADLVGRIQHIVANADARGLERPAIVAGQLGPMAGALGAGYLPIVSRLLSE